MALLGVCREPAAGQEAPLHAALERARAGAEAPGHRFEPGAGWAYSSTNYYLLGVVIERASRLALPRAYRRYLYAPLGLEATWLAWHEEAVGEPAIGFMGPVDGWEHSAMFGELGPTTARDDSGPDSESGYGLGLARMVRGGFSLIGHGGLFTGHTAGSWYLPACDAAIVLYFNRGFVGQRDLLDDVVALLAGGTVGECRPRHPRPESRQQG